MPGIRDAVVPVAAGDVVSPLRSYEDRVGHVLAVAENAYLASRMAEVAVAQLSVRTVAAAPDALEMAA